MGYRDLYFTRPGISTSKKGRRILIFGVPFDGTSSFRPGSRFGPSAFRQTYWNIELYDPVLKVDAEKVPIEDVGDLQVGTVEELVDVLSKVTKEAVREGNVPAFIGGEHTLTYGSAMALENDVTLLIFDAHLDFRDELNGLRLSHGTFLKRMLEAKEIEVLHVGARAASKEEWEEGVKKMKVLPGHEDWMNGLKREVKRVEKLYVSIDLDVSDPAFAPGVGNPEAGGISSKELIDSLYLLRGKKIVGFDIVELAPPYDNGSTASLACKLFSILSILAGANHAEQD